MPGTLPESVAPAVQAYILALVRTSRELAAQSEGGASKRLLNYGASPRASLALFQAGRALAWLRGADYLSPALVQEIFHDALRRLRRAVRRDPVIAPQLRRAEMNSAMPCHDCQGAEQRRPGSGGAIVVRRPVYTGHQCCGSTTVGGRIDAS